MAIWLLSSSIAGFQWSACIFTVDSVWLADIRRGMGFPTMWYVRPAKPQISLRIHAVWSEALLVAWIFYECYATEWTQFGVSKSNRRLLRLVWVCTCQNATLFEIMCRGSYIQVQHRKVLCIPHVWKNWCLELLRFRGSKLSTLT